MTYVWSRTYRAVLFFPSWVSCVRWRTWSGRGRAPMMSTVSVTSARTAQEMAATRTACTVRSWCCGLASFTATTGRAGGSPREETREVHCCDRASQEGRRGATEADRGSLEAVGGGDFALGPECKGCRARHAGHAADQVGRRLAEERRRRHSQSAVLAHCRSGD